MQIIDKTSHQQLGTNTNYRPRNIHGNDISEMMVILKNKKN